MFKTIKNDMFNISNRLKAIDSNYCVSFNTKTKKYEIYYKRGFDFELELVLPFDFLDSRTLRKVIESRVEKMAEIIKAMEEENMRIEEQNNKALKEELISRTKILFKKGV